MTITFLLVMLKNYFLHALLKKLANFLKTKIKNEKVHRVLEFNQPKLLKLYIEFNT